MKGTVKALGSRDWNGKTLHSFRVDDDWYGCGEDKPGVDKGDLIEFEPKRLNNGRFVVDVKNINVLRKAASPAVSRGGRGNFGGGARDEYWQKREERDVITQQIIQLQSSRNSAIALADVLLKNNAVKLPEAQAKKMDVVVALVKELTGLFEAESLAHRGMAESTPDPEPEEEAKDTDDGDDEIWSE